MAGAVLPTDLRSRLESARLDVLALVRAVDRLTETARELPRLKELFELDADCAEALRALDQPHGTIDNRTMLRDTLASLARIPVVRKRYLDGLATAARQRVTVLRNLSTTLRQ
jgi:hypothetical protein